MRNIIYLFIVLLIIYSLCYFIFNNEIELLQIEKNNLTMDLLIQKNPIIIQNNIDLDFIKSIFKNNIINIIKPNELWNRNNSKYVIIIPITDTNIFISKPKKIKYEIPNKDEIIIDVKLKKNNSILLPFKWYYSLNNVDDVMAIGIHDYITYLLKFIF
jgi:hypothetical protein